jgi:hypothetical protein
MDGKKCTQSTKTSVSGVLGVDVNKQALLAFLGEYTTRHYSELGDMPYPGDSLFIAGLFTDPTTTVPAFEKQDFCI